MEGSNRQCWVMGDVRQSSCVFLPRTELHHSQVWPFNDTGETYLGSIILLYIYVSRTNLKVVYKHLISLCQMAKHGRLHILVGFLPPFFVF